MVSFKETWRARGEAVQRERGAIDGAAMTGGGADGPRTQASLLVDKIRADIVGGALAPGEKLKLGELSDRYDCGINPLREALARLGATGLVVLEEPRVDPEPGPASGHRALAAAEAARRGIDGTRGRAGETQRSSRCRLPGCTGTRCRGARR